MTRILEPGEVVLANSPAYTIAFSDPVWVRTYVSEPDLGRIHPCMKAEVFTDSPRPGPIRAGSASSHRSLSSRRRPVETPELRTSLVYRLGCT